jgi:hypothetical protein
MACDEHYDHDQYKGWYRQPEDQREENQEEKDETKKKELVHTHDHREDSWFRNPYLIEIPVSDYYNKRDTWTTSLNYPCNVPLPASTSLFGMFKNPAGSDQLENVIIQCMRFVAPRIDTLDGMRLCLIFGIPLDATLEKMETAIQLHGITILTILRPDANLGSNCPVFLWLYEILTWLFNWWHTTVEINQHTSIAQHLPTFNFHVFLNTIHAAFLNSNTFKRLKIYFTRAITMQTTREHADIVTPDLIAQHFAMPGHPAFQWQKSDIALFVHPWLTFARADMYIELDGHTTQFRRGDIGTVNEFEHPQRLETVAELHHNDWLRRIFEMGKSARRLLKYVAENGPVPNAVTTIGEEALIILLTELYNQYGVTPIGNIPTLMYTRGGIMLQRATTALEHLISQTLMTCPGSYMRYSTNFTIDLYDCVYKLGSVHFCELWEQMQIVSPIMIVILRILDPDPIAGFTLNDNFIPDFQPGYLDCIRTSRWNQVAVVRPENESEKAIADATRHNIEAAQFRIMMAKERVITLKQICLLFGLIMEIREIFIVLYQSRVVPHVLDNIRTIFDYVAEETAKENRAPEELTIILTPKIAEDVWLVISRESQILGKFAAQLANIQRSFIDQPILNDSCSDGLLTYEFLHRSWCYITIAIAFALNPFLINIARYGFDYTTHPPFDKDEQARLDAEAVAVATEEAEQNKRRAQRKYSPKSRNSEPIEDPMWKKRRQYSGETKSLSRKSDSSDYDEDFNTEGHN